LKKSFFVFKKKGKTHKLNSKNNKSGIKKSILEKYFITFEFNQEYEKLSENGIFLGADKGGKRIIPKIYGFPEKICVFRAFE